MGMLRPNSDIHLIDLEKVNMETESIFTFSVRFLFVKYQTALTYFVNLLQSANHVKVEVLVNSV